MRFDTLGYPLQKGYPKRVPHKGYPKSGTPKRVPQKWYHFGVHIVYHFGVHIVYHFGVHPPWEYEKLGFATLCWPPLGGPKAKNPQFFEPYGSPATRGPTWESWKSWFPWKSWI